MEPLKGPSSGDVPALRMESTMKERDPGDEKLG
jgi:hypothetical protein